MTARSSQKEGGGGGWTHLVKVDLVAQVEVMDVAGEARAESDGELGLEVADLWSAGAM